MTSSWRHNKNNFIKTNIFLPEKNGYLYSKHKSSTCYLEKSLFCWGLTSSVPKATYVGKSSNFLVTAF